MKIRVAAVEALSKKERQGETQEPLMVPEFHPPRPPLWPNANVSFCRFVLNLGLCMTKLREMVLSFPNFKDIFIVNVI